MTILYTDTRNKHRIDADAQAELIRDICYRFMLVQSFFDILHIDLRGDIEGVSMFDTQCQCRIAALGGAAAWEVYRQVAKILPEINHHFRET